MAIPLTNVIQQAVDPLTAQIIALEARVTVLERQLLSLTNDLQNQINVLDGCYGKLEQTYTAVPLNATP